MSELIEFTPRNEEITAKKLREVLKRGDPVLFYPQGCKNLIPVPASWAVVELDEDLFVNLDWVTRLE